MLAITDPAALTMARNTHGALRRPFGDRIVHIGDAANRASSQLGQGANMAMLDARALSRSLDAIADLPQALKAYAVPVAGTFSPTRHALLLAEEASTCSGGASAGRILRTRKWRACTMSSACSSWAC